MNRNVAGINASLFGGCGNIVPSYKANKVAVSSGSDYTRKQVCRSQINIFRRSVLHLKQYQNF